MAKAVAVFGLWPLAVAIIILEWMHYPVMRPISDWLGEFGGLWAALQGIGIPASIFMALYLPERQKKKDDLARLVAHRNIAFFVERFVRKAIAPTIVEGSALKQEWAEGYNACINELDRLNRSEIYPPRLIEKFVDLASHAKQMVFLIKQQSFSDNDKDWARRINENLTGNIAAIDEYLRSQPLIFDKENIAHI
ncbi:MAG: hypothetical protein L0H10_05330 [Comamonas sp.]|nr:hypothetical protein [Comamonas sp.]MDN5503227.1 hypothetical protein [Comamonas sp.]MDN5536499.1 hypothetical protein [Comamonas sp.]